MTAITADQYHSPFERSNRDRDRIRSRSSTPGFRTAATIFGGVAVSLAGIFGILELSSRHTDKTTEAIILRLDSLQSSQHDMGERISRLETRTDARFERLEDKFEQIDQKFALIDRKFEAIDWKFEAVDRKFEQMDRRFEQTDRKIDRLDGKIDRLDGKIDRMIDLLLDRAR
ncbi:hypothetical protein [Cupriavidus agavae]|uniref:Uncharacterized protein n=1 Tax=Cupriavidus agavae TaxID=1001822 RepID=A0A4Q7S6V4_9BURK|nr:hypothetical protein [Cupriavidus agavae]RZT42013.1 hypothetical protein EV147_1029 [Cupriavidus agavae]